MTSQNQLSLHLPAAYRITLQGIVSQRWADWFDGFTMACSTQPDGSPRTCLSGTAADQAALLGILQQLYLLGLPLISVQYVPEGENP